MVGSLEAAGKGTSIGTIVGSIVGEVVGDIVGAVAGSTISKAVYTGAKNYSESDNIGSKINRKYGLCGVKLIASGISSGARSVASFVGGFFG